MIKFIFKFLIILFLLTVIILGVGGYLVYKNLNSPLEVNGHRQLIDVPNGSNLTQVGELIDKATNSDASSVIIRIYAKYKELQNAPIKVHPGAYELNDGQTLIQILEKMDKGDRYYSSLVLIEGWSLKQIKQAFASKDDLKQSISNLTDEEILKNFGAPSEIKSLEGLIHPNTYKYTPGNLDIDILRVAYKKGNEIMDKEWANRAPDLPLKSPYEALILASIIEKETGQKSDRSKIAGVFINRLNHNMLLQTDPTVIYGMGNKYQGKIRKIDLMTDTPWNTYIRKGLPPTPIASPGLESIRAALHPERHDYLYFVSKGDGTSAFAKTLSEHNANVNKYILKKN
ncbi:endolytic transglycosylase MltG [Taylorella equigenitalis]|uniref:endolytic transglycosylase MltG n=1 Tax=Taylorella equigenitalis TaxID=29575 RepID=UPI0023AED475|nr:endolytic transglycosylase MltG [Taylorella equigenitalis]WED99733.1 endolytic transglycosylase MltG [Taylorella equigenitalis]WEE01211.1 endolytic transglycosylase MltG [Taylorella equigenitalis]WFD77748.1 endolytic transglycosylase MltG [Taylorella equigenitalis]WFD79226.1 endolytic transglycosylase MltG [Taylorella equigenitalis]WFD80702.1 endolytic transglycosylase MltG [Taylorella equigenitalis]